MQPSSNFEASLFAPDLASFTAPVPTLADQCKHVICLNESIVERTRRLDMHLGARIREVQRALFDRDPDAAEQHLAKWIGALSHLGFYPDANGSVQRIEQFSPHKPDSTAAQTHHTQYAPLPVDVPLEDERGLRSIDAMIGDIAFKSVLGGGRLELVGASGLPQDATSSQKVDGQKQPVLIYRAVVPYRIEFLPVHQHYGVPLSFPSSSPVLMVRNRINGWMMTIEARPVVMREDEASLPLFLFKDADVIYIVETTPRKGEESPEKIILAVVRQGKEGRVLMEVPITMNEDYPTAPTECTSHTLR